MKMPTTRRPLDRVFFSAAVVFGVGASVFSLGATPPRAAAADSVRAILLDADGAPTEKTLAGTFESISPDGLVLVGDDGAKTTIASDAVLWTQFDGEPLEFSSARAETANGNFAAALEKLAAISADDLKSGGPRVAREFEWLKAEATARAALAGDGSAKLNDAGRLLNAFVKAAPDHCRYYDANALIGDALTKLGQPDKAATFFERLAAAKVPTIQARGKIALGEAALAAGELDRAQTLFDEALQAANDGDSTAETVGDAATFAGTNVRILARLGAARVLARRGNSAEAEKAFAEILAATPNAAVLLQAKIYNALGAARADVGKTKEAIAAYLHVELLYRQATGERVQALRALAELWPKVDRPDRADAAKKTLKDRFGVDAP